MVQQLDEEAIFNVARKIDSLEARGRYLDQVCGADAALCGRVQALLKVHDGDQSFLQAPAAALGPALGATVDEPSVSERPGAVIGPYKLLEQIGEGGFGIVFMAEQTQPVRRKVALKVLKPGMDTRHVVARFEAERQALALMDHPNIARVFDGGETTSGRPYFVMELVRGVPITDFCDANHMPVRARLDLFVNVCQAVQHAHQKGIIHRDLKPSNIMITLHDGTPVVKVIDFGIAKALGQQLTDKTLFTNFAQMIGTPIYMSPEQAEMSGLDMDTRSDVYSLGVLLYELLTGTTPCDKERLKTAAFDEIRRMIREDEPATPSTRITTLGAEATLVSANRKSDPRRLSQSVRGDLDWIVMKALEKDRRRRYETASALAADVHRYLNDEPVQACPPSVGYRLRKYCRRNKAGVVVAGLVGFVLTLLLVLGIGVLVNNATRDERDTAQANQKRAEDAEQRALDAEREIKIRAHLARAVASRRSGQVGQRYRTLAEVADALKLNPSPELRGELRTEATAALVLPDVEVAQEWEGWPEDAYSVSFDAAFQRYARLDKQGGMTICRMKDAREEMLHRFPPHGKPAFGHVSMSPDGRFAACGHSKLGTPVFTGVSVWKLYGAEPGLVTLDEPANIYESALAFHSSSGRLAIGHTDRTVSVYDLANGRRVHRLATNSAPGHLAFHPRDGRLAVACGNTVQLFDTDTGRELPALRHPATLHHLAWHPDGRRLAAGCYDRKIHVWNTETAAEVMLPWTGHTNDGLKVAFNHAGDRLVSVDWSGVLMLWDAVTGRILLTLPRDLGLQFSTDDRLLGPWLGGNKIRLYRLAAGRELRVLRRRHADSLENITFPVVNADGHTLAACDPHRLTFFDLASGEELASVLQPLAHAASPMYFQPAPPRGEGGQRREGEGSGGWVTGGYSGMLFWPARPDAARPEVLSIGPPKQFAPGMGARGASASANGLVVAVPHHGSTVVVHRGSRPEGRLVLRPLSGVQSTAVSHDGRWVVTCIWHWDGRSSTACVWDAGTGKQAHELPLFENYTTTKFSPGDRWLATRSSGGVRLWTTGTCEVHRWDNGEFAFNPDGRLLAIGDIPGVIRLVETETGREVARLTGPEAISYTPACFTPDGTRLIAGCSGETALYVWDLRLIREQLKELDLDWEWEEFKPADPASKTAAPSKVEVHLGDLAKLTPARAQQAALDIDHYRRAVEANPDDPNANNSLAWAYLTAPDPLRNVKAAVPLAEKAVRRNPQSALYGNTLGVAYYRAARYREAVDVLRANLVRQDDQTLAFDLYFLAMSYHQLGETVRARDYYEWAVRWEKAQQSLSADHLAELATFRAEAEKLFGTVKKKD